MHFRSAGSRWCSWQAEEREGTTMARTRDYMTIGETVESLQPAHPDLTISKVRFLEDEGLVTPERTTGGYRKFSAQDAARVDLVLRLQKEHFLPLAVIRDKLKDLDKGRVPEELRPMVSQRRSSAIRRILAQPAVHQQAARRDAGRSQVVVAAMPVPVGARGVGVVA